VNENDRESLPAFARIEETREQTVLQPGCLVGGMGASAGGLDACEQFSTHMPPDTGAPGGGVAFVLV
jgi:hypothetical protein